MRPGKINFFLILTSFLLSISNSNSEDKILSSPLINLEKLKPTFESVDDSSEDQLKDKKIFSKKKKILTDDIFSVKLIGLDKITAKTLEINLNIGEIKKFGPLEIKVLKCGVINKDNLKDNVAYLQVKDLSVNQNEKVFIFNGWTFSSDPSLTPFDHAIYDLQLLNCN
jgi:hypothetical protein